MRRLIIIAALIGIAAASTDQFQQLYPQNAARLAGTLQNNCSTEYHSYLISNRTVLEEHGYSLSALAAPVASCLLGAIDEILKSNFASAGVILGVAPTIFAQLGSNTQENAALSVIARRRLLAFCRAVGSPSVTPIRPFNYPGIDALLRDESGLEGIFLKFGTRGNAVVTLCQFSLALASVANVAQVSYELGHRTIASFAPENTFLALLWAFLAAAVHIGGTLSLHLRIRAAPAPRSGDDEQDPRTSFWAGWHHALALELTPAGSHRPLRLEPVRNRVATYLFLCVSWLTSVGTAIHILYGTVMFSSVLFVSVRDALFVIARFGASVLCCQAIVSYELAGLRHIYAAQYRRRPSTAGTELVPLQPLESPRQ